MFGYCLVWFGFVCCLASVSFDVECDLPICGGLYCAFGLMLDICYGFLCWLLQVVLGCCDLVLLVACGFCVSWFWLLLVLV